MTNYNERLDEIERHFRSAWKQTQHKTVQVPAYGLAWQEAKQDITSLIKELVEEAINSECLALLNDLEEEQAACYSNHHKNSETFVPFVSLGIIQKAKEKYFEIAKERIKEQPNDQPE